MNTGGAASGTSPGVVVVDTVDFVLVRGGTVVGVVVDGGAVGAQPDATSTSPISTEEAFASMVMIRHPFVA